MSKTSTTSAKVTSHVEKMRRGAKKRREYDESRAPAGVDPASWVWINQGRLPSFKRIASEITAEIRKLVDESDRLAEAWEAGAEGYEAAVAAVFDAVRANVEAIQQVRRAKKGRPRKAQPRREWPTEMLGPYPSPGRGLEEIDEGNLEGPLLARYRAFRPDTTRCEQEFHERWREFHGRDDSPPAWLQLMIAGACKTRAWYGSPDEWADLLMEDRGFGGGADPDGDLDDLDTEVWRDVDPGEYVPDDDLGF